MAQYKGTNLTITGSFVEHILGTGEYSMKKKSLSTGFGGVYDKGENLVAAQWAMDSNVSTVRIALIFIAYTYWQHK